MQRGRGLPDWLLTVRTSLLAERARLMVVNTIVNVILVAAKAVAVIYSASISLTASLVDSVLDLLSTIIILGTSWAIGVQTDKHKVSAGHV
jgi:divalent metal cation (Fe/Co/Zn/Cd) transporter